MLGAGLALPKLGTMAGLCTGSQLVSLVVYSNIDNFIIFGVFLNVLFIF